ncbi:MAG: L-serine ammonia-lyase, iron-sulfur-dependent, subunit alpha [Lachnospirales bacterium]
MNTIAELIKSAEEKNTTISQIILNETIEKDEISKEEILKRMSESFLVMEESIEKGLEKDIKSLSGLTGGNAYLMNNSTSNFSGSFTKDIISYALAVTEVNACMGKIVAAPTAGSCGILPACLCVLKKHNNIPNKKIIMSLLNASGIGMVIAKNASISGAEGGCQAECGSASAMAASAIVEILGGTPEMCGHAIAQAIKSQMGLVCDPVAGLVEEPCIVRNVSSSIIAVTSAEMSLAGIKSIIPADEVISAMDSVGKQIPPALRETSCGGLAVTKTGLEIKNRLYSHS